jgi:signal transduction histidine kinase
MPILSRPAPDLKVTREIVNDIIADARRTNDIFTNIRDLFRNSRGDLQQVNMNDVVIGLLQSLQYHLDDYAVISRVELEIELPTIMGHKGQLQEVLFNLIHNALDAMMSGSTARRNLLVRTKKRGHKEISISVQDSGLGIKPECLDRIFDPFVTTKKSGMGLGLAICRMIIERHGGQLLASSDVGIGAQFEIILPIEPAANIAPQSTVRKISVTWPHLFLRRWRRTEDAPTLAPRATLRRDSRHRTG